jgi:hypothetical protein
MRPGRGFEAKRVVGVPASRNGDERCQENGFRDKFVAHRELDFFEPVPNFDTALAVAYYYDKWVREIIAPATLAEPPLKLFAMSQRDLVARWWTSYLAPQRKSRNGRGVAFRSGTSPKPRIRPAAHIVETAIFRWRRSCVQITTRSTSSRLISSWRRGSFLAVVPTISGSSIASRMAPGSVL